MKTALLFAAVLLLAGCSASVRPLHPDTENVSTEMLARAKALGLDLSNTSEPALAKAIAQAEAYCQMREERLRVAVAENLRSGEAVPVVHMECE